MSRNTAISLLAVLGLMLSGCASLGAKYTPDSNVPANRAAVYLYRPGSLGAAINPNVVANGVTLAGLPARCGSNTCSGYRC